MYVFAALVAGIGVGYLRGGRLRNVGDADLRWLPALVAGAVLQGVATLVAGGGGVALVLVSYGAVVAFTAMNLLNAGMGVVLVGVVMNAIVIGANGGMPVRPAAIVAAGIAEPSEIDELAIEVDGKRHIERDGDRFMVLADIIPVPLGPVAQVVSFGDLAMSVGVADVIVHLMRRRARVRPWRPGDEPASPTLER